MKLSELTATVDGAVAPAARGRRRRSRSAASPTTAAPSRPGALFFCVPGLRSDGHDFAPRRRRARAPPRSSSSARSASGVPEVLVASARAAMAPLAARFYGDPTAELAVVGVTGHQRQDDHRVPDRARCSRPPGDRAGCSAPSSR